MSYPGFSKNFALQGIHLLDFSGKKMKGSFLFGHELKAGPGLATLPDPIRRFLAPHILSRRDAMPKIIPMPLRTEKVVAERDQLSHGRLIYVVSVFPADGACSPVDKLKTLIDMDLKNSRTVSERGGQTAPSEVTSHELWTV